MNKKSVLFYLVLGAVYSLSFAPGPLPSILLPWVQVFALAWLVHKVIKSQSARQAGLIGLLFGLGTFVTGLYWLTISMHYFGGMPMILAIIALIGFSAYLALYPALSAWAMRLLWGTGGHQTVLSPARTIALSLIWASTWTLGEWLRATVLTGFAWLNTAAGQVDGWLSGWSAWVGPYGVTFLTAWTAAVLAVTLANTSAQGGAHFKGTRALPLLIAGVLCALGAVLGQLRISQPIGSPLVIRLVQGDVSQADKFSAAGFTRAMDLYQSLAAHQQDGQPATPDLILLPETVMTRMPHQIPDSVWNVWIHIARDKDAVLMMGSPMPGANAGQYTNSVIAVSGDDHPQALVNGQVSARYDKRHLVPFGEFVPTGFRWFVDMMNIPLGDFSRGAPEQLPITVQTQSIAPNICYEDVFAQELLPAIRQGATILANFSNLGWFGNSVALRQHWQMSRLRAMESQRPMVRSTNTGTSGAIDELGQPIAVLPTMAAGYVDVQIQGQTGLTPYVRTGNAPVLLLCVLVVLLAGLSRARHHSTP